MVGGRQRRPGHAAENVSEEGPASLTELERDRLARIGEVMAEQFGYISIQGTRR